MKIGILLNTNDPETVWNAFRFGVTALKARHEVRMFLYGKGVESENIKNEFDIVGQINLFTEDGGKILACESCLKMRQKGSGNMCMIGHQKDMLEIVEESDKLLTFG